MQILTRFNKVIAYSNSNYIPVGSTAICAMTGEYYNDVLITEVDCVPTDIDMYEYYYINGKFVKGCSNSEIRETNMRKKTQFWVGTTAQYNVLTTKDENTLYILTDDDSAESLDKISEMLEGIINGTIAVSNATKWCGFGTTDVFTVGQTGGATGIARKAQNDEYGNNIYDTYVKKTDLNTDWVSATPDSLYLEAGKTYQVRFEIVTYLGDIASVTCLSNTLYVFDCENQLSVHYPSIHVGNSHYDFSSTKYVNGHKLVVQKVTGEESVSWTGWATNVKYREIR